MERASTTIRLRNTRAINRSRTRPSGRIRATTRISAPRVRMPAVLEETAYTAFRTTGSELSKHPLPLSVHGAIGVATTRTKTGVATTTGRHTSLIFGFRQAVLSTRVLRERTSILSFSIYFCGRAPFRSPPNTWFAADIYRYVNGTLREARVTTAATHTSRSLGDFSC